MNNNKPKILAIMQIPPPIHGQSMMNKFIYDSKKINNEFYIKTIPLHFTKLDNIGSFSLLKIFFMFKYFLIILLQLTVFKPNAVYFTLSPIGGAFYRDVLYVFLFKLFRIKIIYHLHGKGIINKTKDSKVNSLLYNFVFRNTNVIHLSGILFNDLKNITTNYDKFIVENGILKNEKSNITIKEHNIPKILYLSNIEETKGILDLINACKLLFEQRIKFELSIVGGIVKSIPKEKFMGIIEDKQEYIKYLGPKYGKDKEDILESSDIFVFPTYYPNECFPLVVLEAMQAGLPVVSTYEGAIPDIVDDGQTGFIVKQRNVEELAEKIKILIKDTELREKMGKAGRKKFLEKYTLDTFEKNMVSTFNKILNI